MATLKSWVSKLTGSTLTLDSLETLLVEQLKDLYSAEEQLIAALPKTAAAASSPELKKAFQAHLIETQGQKTRLEKAFRDLGREPESESCEAMEGLIAEVQEIIAMGGDPQVKDAALIAGAQRIEHYEIAGYGCARTFAQQLGHKNVAQTLQQTLEEEARTDQKLTQIAETLINPRAAKA